MYTSLRAGATAPASLFENTLQGDHLEVLLKQTFITDLHYVTKSNKVHHLTVHSGPFDMARAANRFLHGLPHRRCFLTECPPRTDAHSSARCLVCRDAFRMLSTSILPTKSSTIVFSWAMVVSSHLTTCAMTCDQMLKSRHERSGL